MNETQTEIRQYKKSKIKSFLITGAMIAGFVATFGWMALIVIF